MAISSGHEMIKEPTASSTFTTYPSIELSTIRLEMINVFKCELTLDPNFIICSNIYCSKILTSDEISCYICTFCCEHYQKTGELRGKDKSPEGQDDTNLLSTNLESSKPEIKSNVTERLENRESTTHTPLYHAECFNAIMRRESNENICRHCYYHFLLTMNLKENGMECGPQFVSMITQNPHSMQDQNGNVTPLENTKNHSANSLDDPSLIKEGEFYVTTFNYRSNCDPFYKDKSKSKINNNQDKEKDKKSPLKKKPSPKKKNSIDFEKIIQENEDKIITTFLNDMIPDDPSRCRNKFCQTLLRKQTGKRYFCQDCYSCYINTLRLRGKEYQPSQELGQRPLPPSPSTLSLQSSNLKKEMIEKFADHMVERDSILCRNKFCRIKLTKRDKSDICNCCCSYYKIYNILRKDESIHKSEAMKSLLASRDGYLKSKEREREMEREKEREMEKERESSSTFSHKESFNDKDYERPSSSLTFAQLDDTVPTEQIESSIDDFLNLDYFKDGQPGNVVADKAI